MRPATSVRPEPGSNSPLKSLACLCHMTRCLDQDKTKNHVVRCLPSCLTTGSGEECLSGARCGWSAFAGSPLLAFAQAGIEADAFRHECLRTHAGGIHPHWLCFVSSVFKEQLCRPRGVVSASITKSGGGAGQSIAGFCLDDRPEPQNRCLQILAAQTEICTACLGGLNTIADNPNFHNLFGQEILD